MIYKFSRNNTIKSKKKKKTLKNNETYYEKCKVLLKLITLLICRDTGKYMNGKCGFTLWSEWSGKRQYEELLLKKATTKLS